MSRNYPLGNILNLINATPLKLILGHFNPLHPWHSRI